MNKEKEANGYLTAWLRTHGSVSFPIEKEKEEERLWPWIPTGIASIVAPASVYQYFLLTLPADVFNLPNKQVGIYCFMLMAWIVGPLAVYVLLKFVVPNTFLYKTVKEEEYIYLQLVHDEFRLDSKAVKTFQDFFKIKEFDLDSLLAAMERVETEKEIVKHRAESRHDKFLAHFQNNSEWMVK